MTTEGTSATSAKTTGKRDEKYSKEQKTDFIKIGDPESAEAKDSDHEYRTSVSGVLLERGRMNMSGGVVGRYKIEQEDDAPVTFLGSVILDDKMSLVEVGTDVYVGYIGSEKSSTAGHSRTKMFEVFTAE